MANDRADGSESNGEPSEELPGSDMGPSGVEGLAVRAARWMVDRAPTTGRGRVAVVALATLGLTVPSAALLIALISFDKDEAVRGFAALSYAGVFLANFLSTATVFIPTPGLLAVGQALIVTSASSNPPWLVGLIGGLGMGLGETTGYITGLVGSEAARLAKPEPPSWLKPVLERSIRGVTWLMEHFGLQTLFVLSVIPDPVFEVAGITAGATRIRLPKFLVVVVAGNCIRGLILAYLGDEFF